MTCHRCGEDHFEVEVYETTDVDGRLRLIRRTTDSMPCPAIVAALERHWNLTRDRAVILIT